MNKYNLFLGLLTSFYWVACGNSNVKINGVGGQIFQARLSDSTLLLYTIADHKGYKSSSGGRSTSTTYEVATLTGLRLNGTQIDSLYQVKSPCDRDDCSRYNMDKVLAIGSHYWAMECHCSHTFVVVQVADGKTMFHSTQLAEKYPELKLGIAEWETNRHLDAVTLVANDGKTYFLSMNDLQLSPYSEGKFSPDCMNGDIPETTREVSMNGQNYYFDMNIEDKQSFLVARSAHSGTSQSRLHRTGEAWLCPDFLSDPQHCQAFTYNKNLLVLHAKKWNDGLEKDLLTMIDEKGNRKFTIPIDSLGKQKRWLIAKNQYLYTVSPKMISILDLQNGQIVQRITHGNWNNKK